MTDERLRELERRYRSSASLDDGVAWLVERARVGVTNADGVRFASYLGDAPAKAALSSLRLVGPNAEQEVGNWVHGMPGYWVDDFPYLREVCHRVGAALAHVTLASLAERGLGHQAGEGMDRWIVFGLEADRESALESAHRFQAEHHGGGLFSRLAGRRERRLARALVAALAPAQWPDIHVNAAPSRAAADLASLLGEQAVRDGVARDLVPWALGCFDPVRERVELPQGGAE